MSVRWTAAQDEILRRDYGNVPAAIIAKTIGRSCAAVTQRAFLFGLCHASKGYRPGGVVGHRGDSRPGYVTFSVYFDDETFEEVKRVAEEDGLSFSRATMQLIEWGLMDRAGSREAA